MHLSVQPGQGLVRTVMDPLLGLDRFRLVLTNSRGK